MTEHGRVGLRRVGLFGGSFDPVHRAHIALGQAALDQLELDELRWLPAGQPWQKAAAITPAEHRVAMLRTALPADARHVLDTREIERAGPSYSIDSVLSLQSEQPEARWFLVLGADQFMRLPTWHRVAELLALVTLAVAHRPGSSTANGCALTHAAKVQWLSLPPMDVSSSALRAARDAGQPWRDLVPASVAHYIEAHHLYADTNCPSGLPRS